MIILLVKFSLLVAFLYSFLLPFIWWIKIIKLWSHCVHQPAMKRRRSSGPAVVSFLSVISSTSSSNFCMLFWNECAVNGRPNVVVDTDMVWRLKHIRSRIYVSDRSRKNMIVSRPHPFTRCRARAQADHTLRHAGKLVTLRAKLSGAVHCNRSCLWVCLFVGLFVCLWVCYHDNSKLHASILIKLGL